MPEIQHRSAAEGGSSSERFATIRRAFDEFLTVPTGIVVFFLLLSVLTSYLDQANVGSSVRVWMQERIFSDAQSTSNLLGTIAGSIITMTSITFSLLLLAVQQSASSLTSVIFDQFVRRSINQVSFGFFVGLAIFALVILATVNPPFNPIYGAALALTLTFVSLLLLLLLLYSTIDQMRPSTIILSIHDHILAARAEQQTLLGETRRDSWYDGPIRVPVRAERSGFVVEVDVEAMQAAAGEASGEIEVVLRVSIGSYVAFHDTVALIKADASEGAKRMEGAVRDAIHLERERQIVRDPAYGIAQLETIAWTNISTSKQNPTPGLLVVQNLRDVLARWATEEEEEGDKPKAPVVYPDNVMAMLMNTFESLAVVASESMQHQVCAAILDAFALLFDRLPAPQQARTETLILRVLSTLGDHALTAELDAALTALADTLIAHGRREVAAALLTAQATLATSVGELNSRATRVPS
jgi:uncharacterized membrane protein